MGDDVLQQLESALGDDYRIERELGGGGMAYVFLAEELRLGRRVVVKVVKPTLGASVSADRFEREIRVAARLQDPHIVPLLTAGRGSGISYYTMPYVEGESLRARLTRGRIPVAEAIGILRDIALALEYAHARQFAHRDVKPENILLTGHTAVVTDFGIAKAIAAATDASGRDALTTAGGILGTPAYMAPEQAAGDSVDHRVDLYAWGIVAYEMLTGAHPFAGVPSGQHMIAAQVTTTPAPLLSQAPALPRELASLVDRTLTKEREQRPASATELLGVLDALAPTNAANTWRASTLRRRTNAVVFVGSLALVAVAAVLMQRQTVSTRSGATPDAGAVDVRGQESENSTPRSVAVLPFTSPDGDSLNAYFGSGMAEELTMNFARVPGLRVASRGAASRLEEAGSADTEIAQQLGVTTLLEGTVRRSGERIRVSARLIEPLHGTVLWADQYDRKMAEVFDVQDEITRAIVSALRPTLGGTTQLAEARAVRRTGDLEAYDLFLKGRYYWGRRGGEGLRMAIDYFEQALQRDSGFARAWAGLSMAQVVMPVFAHAPADSLLRLAAANAQHALRLDSSLADAHLAWAYALKGQWRWSESEQQLQQAVALAPDDATIHHWYGVLLYVVGRTDEAIAQLRRARALDPLSVPVSVDLMYGLYLAGRYDEAYEEARRAISMDPNRSDIFLQVGEVDLATGRADSAARAFETAARLGIGFEMGAFLSLAERRLGRQQEGDSIYRALLVKYDHERAISYAIIVAAAGAGDLTRGVAALRESVRRRSLFLTELGLACDPVFDPLKRDPRFGQILASAGLRMCPAVESQRPKPVVRESAQPYGRRTTQRVSARNLRAETTGHSVRARPSSVSAA